MQAKLALDDPRALRALAHPLRLRLLRLLRNLGPATATRLADQVDEVPASVSFHMRQLARYGFVEEISGRGRGRERWWRAAYRSQTVDASRLSGPDARLAAAELAETVLRQAFAIHLESSRASEAVGPEWQPHDTEVGVWVTSAERGQIVSEVESLLGRYSERTATEHPEGAELCHLTFLAARWMKP
jgi:DNA-binding transcriptional ArsR family regulator